MKRKNNLVKILLLCICFVSFTISFILSTNIKANETTYYFDYTGAIQTFIAPKTGKYYIEAYGASGGGARTTTVSGYGGYTNGYINLKENETIYICVGGVGQQTSNGASGGYNGGGGSSNAAGSGGGATSITTINRGVLSNFANYKDEVITVAAGGGGQQSTAYTSGKLGCGGGIDGLGSKNNPYAGPWSASNTYLQHAYFSGGRQDFGYAFGQGSPSCTTYNNGYAGAGGGGWYGGNTIPSNLASAMGGGGSSYIKGLYDATTKEGLNYGNGYATITYQGEIPLVLTIDTSNGGTWNGQSGKISLSTSYDETISLDNLQINDNYEFIEWQVMDGNAILDEVNNTITMKEDSVVIKALYKAPLTLSGTQTNNVVDLYYEEDDGFDKFYQVYQSKDGETWNYLGLEGQSDQTNQSVWTYGYTGYTQEFVAPNEGTYKLEVYGAQGGHATYGGKGGYSTGTIYLKKGQTLYVNVGQQPTNVYGGWNGGSIGATQTGHGTYYGGGGATDISLYGTKGTTSWNTTNHLYSRIIVAGGGGAGSYYSNGWAYGGIGGGEIGGNGTSSGNGIDRGECPYGGTQISGGQEAGPNWGYGVKGEFGYAGMANVGYGSGSGGGWYGGGGGGHTSDRVYSGAGGSGYVYTINTMVNYPTGCLLNEDFYLTNASTQGGVRAGHGYARITCIEVSYKSNDVENIELKDTTAPTIPQNIKVVSKDTTTTLLEWSNSKDYGDTYNFKVSSYENETKELIQTSNIIELEAISGLKGYYYYLDNTESGIVKNTHTFVETNSLTLTNNPYKYLHIAAVDNYGNVGETYTMELSNISITGTIIWNDENNQFSSRPQFLNVDLYCNGEKIDTIQVGNVSKTRNTTNSDVWEYNFSGLNVYDENNNICNYETKIDFGENISQNEQWEYNPSSSDDGYVTTMELEPIFHTVICKDYVNDENGQLLGTSEKQYQYGDIASGSDWGTSIETNEYYIGYKYDSCTSNTVNGDIVVCRFFKESNYKVVFDGNGATSGNVEEQEYVFNSTYDLPYNNFVREGYTFLNWNTRTNGSGISYAENEEVSNLCSVGTSSITLYANWQINQYPVTYIDVIDDANGLVLGKTIKMVDYGTIVRGEDLENTNNEPNEIYEKYVYIEDTSEVVTTNGAIVYRIFNLLTTGKPIAIVWEDNDNVGNIRPKTITIHVSNKGQKVSSHTFDINKTNVYIIENLQQYDDDGNEIEYEFSLSDIDGYMINTEDDTIVCTAYNMTSENNENEVQVCVTQASSFNVTIPKTIVLGGESKSGNYEVRVKGDIGGLDTISVMPTTSFYLSQFGKNDILGNVTQEQTLFCLEDGIENGATITGTIFAKDMTAGSWFGSFYFDIKLNTNSKVNSIGSIEEDIFITNVVGKDQVQEKQTLYMFGMNYSNLRLTSKRLEFLS